MIDSHVHVVVGNPSYPKCLSVEDLVAAMDDAGVERAIVVQSLSGNGLDDPTPVQSAARYPRHLIAVCGGDPAASDAAETLRRRIGEWGARGVRVFWGPTPLAAPAHQQFWAAAEDLAVPVLIAGQARFAEVGDLLESFPSLRIVVDHCGDPEMSRGLPAELLRLADRAGVFMKYSSHVHDRAERQGMAPQAVIDGLVAAFGAGRILWGSNYPASHEPRWTYAGAVAAFRELIAPYGAAERQAMEAGTAASLWPELAPSSAERDAFARDK